MKLEKTWFVEKDKDDLDMKDKDSWELGHVLRRDPDQCKDHQCVENVWTLKFEVKKREGDRKQQIYYTDTTEKDRRARFNTTEVIN